MMHCAQGLHDFLRAYYHCKSADFTANRPHPLAGSTAEELAKLPRYYVMELDETMPQTVAPYMPSPAEITACRWLTEDDLDVYVTEYERTGFQGALQWYRAQVGRPDLAQLQLFAGRRVDVLSMFIAGRSDSGRTSHPGRVRAHAIGLHRHGRLPIRRRRRALAPARTTRSGDRPTGGVSVEIAQTRASSALMDLSRLRVSNRDLLPNPYSAGNPVQRNIFENSLRTVGWFRPSASPVRGLRVRGVAAAEGPGAVRVLVATATPARRLLPG